MLNISATQELYRKIEALEKQNEQLQNIQKVVLELKAEINNIKSLPISKN
jgi:cell shape-determining protein MreC